MPYGYDPKEPPCYICRVIVVAAIVVVGVAVFQGAKSTPPSANARFVKTAAERDISWDDYREYCKSKNMIMVAARGMSAKCVVGEKIEEENVRKYLIEKEKQKQ